jgi:hypothetical protein
MTIGDEQRSKMTKELAKAFARATGAKRTEHGVDQWEPLVDLLIKVIEGIVQQESRGEPEETNAE